MEIAGDSANGKHQGCCDENEIVPIHPGSEPTRRSFDESGRRTVFAKMK